MRLASLRSTRLSGLIEAFAVLILLALLLGAAGRLWWVFDLCAHFRAQYAGLLVLCVGFLFALGKRRSAAWFALPTAIVLLTLVPTPGGRFAAPSDDQRFKVVSFNVHTDNERHADVLAYLTREAPDLILLLEVNRAWLKDLRPLTDRYPHRLELPADDNFGIAVYSKVPITPAGPAEFGPYRQSVIDVHTVIMGVPTRFLGLHPLPPGSAIHSEMRNDQLRHFAELARKSDVPVVMAGDFNLTPYSPWFSHFLAKSGLKDSGAGFGFTPTWLRSVPCFALPIDHAWISEAFTVVERTIGPSLGSDHNALAFTLGVAPSRQQP